MGKQAVSFRWFDVALGATFFCIGAVVTDTIQSPPLAITIPVISCGVLLILYDPIQSYFDFSLSTWVLTEIVIFLLAMGLTLGVGQVIADRSFLYISAIGWGDPTGGPFRLMIINTASYPFLDVSVKINRIKPTPNFDGMFHAPLKLGDVEMGGTELNWAAPPGEYVIDLYARGHHFLEQLTITAPPSSLTNPASAIELRRWGKNKILLKFPPAPLHPN